MNGYWMNSDKLKAEVPASASATGVLTSDNTNVSDGDTVVIGSITYRFKNTMAQAYDVQIGVDADTSLANLVKAINGSGTPGTEYYAGTSAHPSVSSGNVSSHTITVTARTMGFTGNSVATTETSSHLSWGNATLVGGIGGILSSVSLAVSGSGGQTLTTKPIDVGNYAQLLLFINVAAHNGTSPTLDCKMQYSDDGVSNWVDSGDSFTQITTSDALNFKKPASDFGKFVRFVFTVGGTNPFYTISFSVYASTSPGSSAGSSTVNVTQTMTQQQVDVIPTLSVHSAYASGDYVGETGVAMQFDNIVPSNNGNGIIQSAVLIDKAGQSIPAELWLFDTAITPPTDSAAWAISDADAAHLIGVIPFSAYYADSNNSVSPVNNIGLGFKTIGNAKKIYGCLVTRGAPTYVDQDLVVRLNAIS